MKEMDLFMNELVNVIKMASSEFSVSVNRENKFKVIPGWNRHVKSLHAIARQTFLEWQNQGKPLNTDSHSQMLETRRQFKQALDYVKANENLESCLSIVEKFIGKDFRKF